MNYFIYKYPSYGWFICRQRNATNRSYALQKSLESPNIKHELVFHTVLVAVVVAYQENSLGQITSLILITIPLKDLSLWEEISCGSLLELKTLPCILLFHLDFCGFAHDPKKCRGSSVSNGNQRDWFLPLQAIIGSWVESFTWTTLKSNWRPSV